MHANGTEICQGLTMPWIDDVKAKLNDVYVWMLINKW